MERIIKSLFGLKFWINNPKKQKEVEHEAVRRNLVRFSNCLSGRRLSPQFAGSRNFTRNHVITGR